MQSKLNKTIIVIILIAFFMLMLFFLKKVDSTKNSTNDDYKFIKKEWGAYVGAGVDDLKNFESLAGKPVDHQAVFVHWGNENQFPFEVAENLKSQDKTLIIFWETKDYNQNKIQQPEFNADSINQGNWDQYIKAFAEQAKVYGGPVILIPFEEMNGNWSPWSGTENGNTPAKIIEAYRHIRGLFNGVDNVKFGWTVNAISVPDTSDNVIEAYYPGDQYVDYVGMDGFNFGDPWQNFEQIFSKGLDTISKYNKPIYIFSMACAEGDEKAAWIEDAIETQIPKYPQIKGWVWFNENKEKNWLINSDQNSLEAFKESIND